MELLNKIQRELKVPKSQFNAFAKYNYRNCEDILEAVKPFLTDAILTLGDEMVEVGGRCYVKATATLTEWVREDKGKYVPLSVSTTAYAREALDKKGMDEAQITGAASSYARKYALNGLFCIDDTKDADNEDNTAKKPDAPKSVAKPAAPKSVVIEQKKAEIKKLCDAKVLEPLTTADEYKTYVQENTGLALEEGNYDAIIERLKAL
jgi:hypothetical protein